MSIEHPSFGKLPDNRVIIFDTTLRDGEQSPGFSMNLREKLRMAEALAELGVDVMEAGFPIASVGDFESVAGHRPEHQGPGHLRPGPHRAKPTSCGRPRRCGRPSASASTSSCPPPRCT